MDPFAVAADIVAVWRPLTAEEITVADGLLAQASARLRVAVPTIDAQLEAEGETGLKHDLAKAAVVNAVKRVMQNPDGVLQFSIDDYTERRDSAVSTGALYLDKADLIGLVSRAGSWRMIQLGSAL